MPICLYLAPRHGSGATIDDPIRSILNEMVDISSGEGFEEIVAHDDHWSVCCVHASDATHDVIDADSRVVPMIPIRAQDKAHLKAILTAPFSSYPVAWRTAAKNKMESWNVPTDWITGSHTMRDVLKFLVKMISCRQVLFGHEEGNVLALIKSNLDTTMANIPVAYRNAAGVFLQSKGINTDWITASTTVREVVKSLPDGFAKMYGRNVKLRFAGEDFGDG